MGIAVDKWKRETLSWVDPHAICSLSSVFPWYIWCKLNKLLKYNKYRLTNVDQKENSRFARSFLRKCGSSNTY